MFLINIRTTASAQDAYKGQEEGAVTAAAGGKLKVVGLYYVRIFIRWISPRTAMYTHRGYLNLCTLYTVDKYLCMHIQTYIYIRVYSSHAST